MDVFTSLTLWHWLILSAMLFGIEALGAGGFLLGAALASVVVSILAWAGFTWQTQLFVFAILSVALSVAYWWFFKNFNMQREEPVAINEKMENLKGKVGTVVSLTGEKHGKVQVGDTLWEFQSEQSVEIDAQVKAVSYEGMILLVEPV